MQTTRREAQAPATACSATRIGIVHGGPRHVPVPGGRIVGCRGHGGRRLRVALGRRAQQRGPCVSRDRRRGRRTPTAPQRPSRASAATRTPHDRRPRRRSGLLHMEGPATRTRRGCPCPFTTHPPAAVPARPAGGGGRAPPSAGRTAGASVRGMGGSLRPRTPGVGTQTDVAARGRRRKKAQ